MKLTDFLDIDFPLVQAPMAGAQGSALAIAVAGAGGLGSQPGAMLDAAGLRAELTAIRAKTGKPFNVNFFCHTPRPADPERETQWRAKLTPFYQQYGIDPKNIPAGPGRMPFSTEAIDVLEDFKPAVVSFHFGLPPAPLFARVKALGAKTVCSATTVAEALWLEAQGVDVVIAQGLEAGGHRGIFLSDDLTTQVGTFALLPQVLHAVKIPVIACGGIADARCIEAAMALGAAGVQLGTTYLLCPETLISPIHRAALKSEGTRHTTLTNIFTGRPARGIVNRVIRELGAINESAPAFPLATSAIAPLRAQAEAQGSGDFSPLWSGQNASGCKEIPAAQLTRELVAAF